MDLLNLLGKALSANDWTNLNLIIVSVPVLSLQFQRKSGFVLVVYRPPSTENTKRFFEEMNQVISKALWKCENLVVMGNFTIDIKGSNSDKDKLETFCDFFNLISTRKLALWKIVSL